MQLILEAGCDVNAQSSLVQETALHLASSYGADHSVKLLLSYGADFDVLRANQVSPFDCAIVAGSWELCKIFISSGAKLSPQALNVPNLSQKMTAQQLAVIKTHQMSVQSLQNLCRKVIRKSAKPSFRDSISYLSIPEKLKRFVCMDQAHVYAF
jgi:ankyrin repeat protein